MKKIILTILLLSLNAFAQHEFEIKNASAGFDAKITVEKCDKYFCEGKTIYELFRKGNTNTFQKFAFENALVQLDKDQKPEINMTLLYDKQSALHLEDFNFDGIKDLALNDGANGGYGSPSYQVYLFSKVQNRFVHNPSFSELAQSLGMFEVDKKQKMLFVYSKSGCCWHQTEGYKVSKNRPVKVYEFTNDAMLGDGFVRVTRKKLVNGKWEVKEEKEKMEDDQ